MTKLDRGVGTTESETESHTQAANWAGTGRALGAIGASTPLAT